MKSYQCSSNDSFLKRLKKIMLIKETCILAVICVRELYVNKMDDTDTDVDEFFAYPAVDGDIC